MFIVVFCWEIDISYRIVHIISFTVLLCTKQKREVDVTQFNDIHFIK
ncbi:hypothetical protein BACI71_100083 [Bacillus mycoides]|uniref:Uncharacterized protein n=1 Tax=Bacillus mycoides TaxID=1405 RepID=A0A653MSW7_BACMY|nr:hypothetical protein BACI71_100083 [Bacillus mycoides]